MDFPRTAESVYHITTHCCFPLSLLSSSSYLVRCCRQSCRPHCRRSCTLLHRYRAPAGQSPTSPPLSPLALVPVFIVLVATLCPFATGERDCHLPPPLTRSPAATARRTAVGAFSFPPILASLPRNHTAPSTSHLARHCRTRRAPAYDTVRVVSVGCGICTNP